MPDDLFSASTGSSDYLCWTGPRSELANLLRFAADRVDLLFLSEASSVSCASLDGFVVCLDPASSLVTVTVFYSWGVR